MKQGDWTGITAIPAQHMAMWELMWTINERYAAHFGSSDLAVAQFRRMMVAAVKTFQESGQAIGAQKSVRSVDLASFEGVVPKTVDWRTLGVRAMTKETI